ncbi:cytochrome c oxidase subunit I [Piscinibacter sakaiensis]
MELPEAERAALVRTWRSPGGFWGWFLPVNHAVVGKRFIVTAFVLFLVGGVQALVMRAQLAQPEAGLVDPAAYSMLFTMHGITMMFLFAVPLVEGFIVWLTPMMIGTRDMCFPRLNAFGYWVYLIGAVAIYGYYAVGLAPDAGWFNTVPLASERYSPGHRIDVYTTLITFVEVSALVAAVEIIVTVLRQRAPGMHLGRMPVFVWASLVTAFMILFAMPGVVAGSSMLALDRTVGTRFFDPSAGGDALLWQHLFWWFGHPEVYIIFVPGTAIVSTLIPVFCGRPLFGYTAIVVSLVATGILSFGLWVHHMYATGIPLLAESYFNVASTMIAVPTGVQFFCWIATMWLGRPQLKTPMLFVLGFIVIFLVGGLSGVMVASVPFDLQVHDSYFIVAHLHYVLIGGMVFPAFGAFYYWFPKFAGRLLDERLGRWNFGVMFVGFNLAFFPMHWLGMDGMPRRVYTYPPEMGWGGLNLLVSVGAVVFAVGVLLFVVNAWRSWRGPEDAPDNPWNADTLEWAVSREAAKSYKFAHVPVVDGRHALWSRAERDVQRVVTGLRSDRREVLITSVVDARPRAVVVLPGPTPWPLFTALASTVAFMGVIYTPWSFVAGFFLAFVAIVGWLYPRRPWRDD